MIITGSMDCADISLLSLRPAFAIINQALVQRIISANFRFPETTQIVAGGGKSKGQMGWISQCVVGRRQGPRPGSGLGNLTM